MANYTKTTLTRIGRMMGSGEAGEPPALVKLARAGGFGRKAIYNWSLPDTDAQHRKMPRTAKRMIAMLAYFSAAGLLNDKRLAEIVALETTFENEKETQILLRRIRRMVAPKGGKAGTKAEAGAAGDADAEDTEDAADATETNAAAAAVSHAA